MRPEEQAQDQVDLSVVIPAYLEEENLRILLPRVIRSSAAAAERCEVVVVDTQEPLDHTRAVCEELGATYVRREGGNSFGCAVRTGIAAARGRHVIFMDADGSHPPELIPDLYAHKDEYDVVIASRYVKGGHTENPAYLVWMSWILNMTYRLVLGIDCRDVSNSFKLYRGADLKALTLRCANFDIVEELLVKLNRRAKLRVKELPFTFRKRMFGDTKRNLLWFIATYLVTLLRLRFMR